MARVITVFLSFVCLLVYNAMHDIPQGLLAKLACLIPLGPLHSSKKSSMKRVRMAIRLAVVVPVSPSNLNAPTEAVELIASGPDAASNVAVGHPWYARRASGPAWHRGCQNKRQHTRADAVHISHEARGTVTTSKKREPRLPCNTL